MLYLEDFLELLENLPSELRDRFTDIRTLDLQVQNGLDVADNAVDGLFRNLQSMTPNQIQSSFEKIKEDYKKILENADEKVNLATLMHDLVKKYLSKLDQEVSKFKIELEADSPGITEALEKKVKETERIGGLPRKEKVRKRKRSPTQNGSLTSTGHLLSNMTNGITNPNNAAQRHVSITTHHHEAAPGVLSNSANFVC
uniref:Inhibitor of growth protein N-terminal histone-binding domain-containing protein n=1 Tax=Romanomermis culicivorax TaxID=13658 RepID=A0A915IGX0_ROMCU